MKLLPVTPDQPNKDVDGARWVETNCVHAPFWNYDCVCRFVRVSQPLSFVPLVFAQLALFSTMIALYDDELGSTSWWLSKSRVSSFEIVTLIPRAQSVLPCFLRIKELRRTFMYSFEICIVLKQSPRLRVIVLNAYWFNGLSLKWTYILLFIYKFVVFISIITKLKIV